MPLQRSKALRALAHASLIILASLALTHCGGTGPIEDGPPDYSVNVNNIPNARVRPLPKSPYGNPRSYVVNGHRYYVLPTARGYRARGIASWYGTKFHGQLTSTREPYNLYSMTAASPVLPLPTFVRVTNLNNGRVVIVKVNDRGPFEDNRILDLSYVAAKKLGMLQHGTAPVEVVAIVPGYRPSQEPSGAIASPSYVIHQWQQQNHAQVPSEHSSHGLYLQVGAFGSYANARSMQQSTQQQTRYPVNIIHGAVNGRTLYLVKIGPLPNAQVLQQVENEIG